MLFILSIGALAIQSAEVGWIEFDRRPSGWAVSPYEYEAASLVRRKHRLRVRYRFTTFTSGVPDYHWVIRVEIDCTRRRARDYQRLLYGGIYSMSGTAPYRDRVPTIARPISPGSVEEALARRLCPASAVSGRQDRD